MEDQWAKISRLGQLAEAAKSDQRAAEEAAESAKESSKMAQMVASKKEEQMRNLSDDFAKAVRLV